MRSQPILEISPQIKRANFHLLRITLALAFVTYSCQSNHRKLDPTPLEFNSIITTEPFLATEKLKVLDGYLYSVSAKPIDDYFIRKVSFSANMETKPFLRFGNGPNETNNIVPQSFSINGGDLVLVNSNSELISIAVKSIGDQTLKISKNQLPIETIPTNDLKVLNDSIMVGHSASNLVNKELYTFNRNSKEIKEVGEYFNRSGTSNLSKNILYDLNYSFIEINSTQDLVATIYAKYDKVIIRNLRNDSSKQSDSTLKDNSNRVLNSQGKIDFDKIIPFTIDSDSDDDYIFRLGFLDSTNEEISSLSIEKMSEIKTLLTIFDWEGNLIFSYLLNKPIFKFDIYNKTLFGKSPFEDDKIYTYDLQSIY